MAYKLSIHIAGLVVLFTSSAQMATADDVEVAFLFTARPTITRAVDIVQRTADRVVFGTQVVFKQQQTQQAGRIRRKGFQIRIFALGENETTPTAVTIIDDCSIYISTVHVIYGEDSSDIMFDRMDERWLAISNSGKTVLNGHYLLVFETVGTRDSVFRLHRDDAASYFATGFRLTVEGAVRASVEKVRAAYTAREGELVDLYKEIDKRGKEILCYRYQKYVDDAARQQYAQGSLEMCAAKVAAESLRF